MDIKGAKTVNMSVLSMPSTVVKFKPPSPPIKDINGSEAEAFQKLFEFH